MYKKLLERLFELAWKVELQVIVSRDLTFTYEEKDISDEHLKLKNLLVQLPSFSLKIVPLAS